MEMPSTRNMHIITLNMPSEWQDLTPIALIDAMEKWGAENLKHRRQRKMACIGNYMRDPQSRRSSELANKYQFSNDGPIMGQFWIINHGQYDTGRARVQVQLRETWRGAIEVFNLEDDKIVTGHVTTFRQNEIYTRVHSGPDASDWTMTWATLPRIVQLDEKFPPAVRADELFEQCCNMGRKLSQWLSDNLNVIEERGGEPTTLNPALQRYLRTNLVWYAADPTVLQAGKDHLNDPDLPQPDYRELSLFISRVKNELYRQNRIATPEQIALYQRLKDSCDYIEKIDPSERPIHIPNLIGLHTKWINLIREPIQTFLK